MERTVTSYFDYIEGLIERENTFTMEQLAESVNKFLSFNDYKILEGKGTISKLQADKKAVKEYDDFNTTQKIISDFDKQINKLKELNAKPGRIKNLTLTTKSLPAFFVHYLTLVFCVARPACLFREATG